MYLIPIVSTLLLSLVLGAPSLGAPSHHNTPSHHGTHHAKFARNETTIVANVTANVAANGIASVRRLLVGSSGKIVGYDFDGSSFVPNPAANVLEPGKMASWLAFKEPNILYAVDENSNATRQFFYCNETGTLSSEIASYNGSLGVVHLVFNKEKTRMVGSSYSQGQVDIWASSPSGMLQLLKQVPLTGEPGPVPGSQGMLRAHQTVRDPSGRFFIVNDLGGDKLHVLDSLNDAWEITNSVALTPAGSGPRHGIFLSITGGSQASHYVALCEITNMLHLFEVDYAGNKTLGLRNVQTLSTFDASSPPANATSARAAEIIVTKSGPAEIYVTNRITGNATDSISKFTIEASSSGNSSAQLVWNSTFPVAGVNPRHISFSKGDRSVLFAATAMGPVGLEAIDRKSSTGTPLATTNNLNATDGFGPQFVMEF